MTGRGRTKPPLSEQAYRRIKERIFSLRLSPGSQLDEAALSAELAIGRTPIREAVLRLAAEELLEAVPGRGNFVRSISLEDVKDLFEALLIGERSAVVLAAKRITPRQLEAIRQINLRLDRAMEERDFLAITDFNSRLHRAVYLATGNVFIESSLNQLQNQAQRLAYLCFSNMVNQPDADQHNARVSHQHGRMIDLLATGDAAGLVDLISRHIDLFYFRVSQFTRPSLDGLELIMPQPESDGKPPTSLEAPQGERRLS